MITEKYITTTKTHKKITKAPKTTIDAKGPQDESKRPQNHKATNKDIQDGYKVILTTTTNGCISVPNQSPV